MSHIFNLKSQLSFRRLLRHHQTDAETYLWSALRARRFLQVKFRRQYGIGKFIVDFYSPSQRVAVEVDGGHHFLPPQRQYDLMRDAWLGAHGITVLRFSTMDVMTNRDGVLAEISRHLPAARTSPEPLRNKEGRRMAAGR